jgi:hypothetical protein
MHGPGEMNRTGGAVPKAAGTGLRAELTQRTFLEACVEGSEDWVRAPSPVIDSVRGAFPGRDPNQPNSSHLPHLTVLTSPRSHTHTPPPPLTTSHPGRSNRQTAPRGTGEGFRLCRKPTSHPIPPSTAFVHPLLLIKKIFSAPWMFPLLGRTQPRRPIESARKVRDGHPGSADTRRPPPQQNTTLMTGFNRVVFFSSV